MLAVQWDSNIVLYGNYADALGEDVYPGYMGEGCVLWALFADSSMKVESLNWSFDTPIEDQSRFVQPIELMLQDDGTLQYMWLLQRQRPREVCMTQEPLSKKH